MTPEQRTEYTQPLREWLTKTAECLEGHESSYVYWQLEEFIYTPEEHEALSYSKVINDLKTLKDTTADVSASDFDDKDSRLVHKLVKRLIKELRILRSETRDALDAQAEQLRRDARVARRAEKERKRVQREKAKERKRAEREKAEEQVGAQIEVMTSKLKAGLQKSMVKIRSLEAALAEERARNGSEQGGDSHGVTA